MKKFVYIFICFFVLTTISTSESGFFNKIKASYAKNQIKKEFKFAWDNYKKYAWGHDELLPLTKSYRDWYGEPLAITIIDSLDSLYLMGFKDEFESALKWVIKNVSFDKNIKVQAFEITIRLLGGLISAYQISGNEKLLFMAEDLAERMLPIFNSPTGMPYRYVNLRTGEVEDYINNPAEIGTLTLEFGMISKLTGNKIYYDKAKDGVVKLYNKRSKIDLVGTNINIMTGEWTNKESHIDGAIDSYYEYLYKSWLLFGDKDFFNMFKTSFNAVEKYLSDSYNGMLWYMHVNADTGELINRHIGALCWFYPGLLAFAGNIQKAEELAKSGYWMWNNWGIEPEQIDYSTKEVLNPAYILRPELIESTYYLWKLTGDNKYRDKAYNMFNDIKAFAKCDNGYTRVKNILTGEKDNLMDSFFLAEVLKYLYLIFDDSKLDFDNIIFNSEAHPLKGIQ
jgi:mannosidase alpha-like ER degradation enhancer 2